MRGNITRRGKESWRVKYEAGERDPVTGQRQTHYLTVRGKRKDAEAALTNALKALDDHAYVAPTQMTVSEFFDRWLRDFASVQHSPKTIERETQLLEHARREIGDKSLQKLQPAHLAQLYAKLRRSRNDDGAGLSARTVAHLHRLVHQALGHGVAWGLLVSSPAARDKKVAPPRGDSREVEILTEQQARDVLTALRGKALYPITMLALATGMRRGELLALRWKDIDLDGGKVRVERSLEQTKAGLRFKQPKTKTGRRAIAIPASISAELRAHWKVQQELRLKLGAGKAPDDALVLPNWDGTPRSPRAVSRAWAEAIAGLAVPRVTFHALRHTHASQLIAAGMDVLTISRRLGHGSPTITLDVYGHLFANTDDRAAAVVEAAFGHVLSD